MQALAEHNEVFRYLQPFCGTYTAAVLVTMCDPCQYASARQLEKACGLNLREKSSGEHRGQMSITKRGPSLVRQLLYLLALRKPPRRGSGFERSERKARPRLDYDRGWGEGNPSRGESRDRVREWCSLI